VLLVVEERFDLLFKLVPAKSQLIHFLRCAGVVFCFIINSCFQFTARKM